MCILTSTNPARDYAVLGQVSVSSPAEIIQKVEAARLAQPTWWAIGLEARITHLRRLRDIFKAHREDLIRKPMEEMGVPKGLAASLADSAERTFAWNLDNAHKALDPETLSDDGHIVSEIRFEPYGVVACVVAWNFPYLNFIVSVTHALLAGNTVIMKYSEEIPLFSQYIEGLVNQAGLPRGVVNFIYGDGEVGAQLADQDIDFISFTGSSAVGQKLYEKAASKFIPIMTELGGSSPGVVFEDANLDEQIENIFWERFANTGQFCDGLKRLIVHESRFEECVEKLAASARLKVMGDPQDDKTELGPLVAARQVVKLEAQLKDALDKGAKIICGGKRPEGLKGAYFEPTLLTNITPAMQVWREEVFGPVLPIVSFKTYEEAMKLANDTMYGLSGYIYTQDKDLESRAIRDIKAGSIGVNGMSSGPDAPFGGYKKSGMGRAYGIAGFRGLTQTKTVSRPK